ncbi:hypothetical protein Pla110_19130 [Polystyrenella longa]|uniref:YHS domain protein n=1 Tax=Polystyrenella longa TaxID=2528007 RepID=A0A518CLS0_9PLAN|nr:hypothetical protein [Polystyrenella longa]QDU80189.1 hypothetical protein Pla110_19130 [Polystyrenella longa]
MSIYTARSYTAIFRSLLLILPIMMLNAPLSAQSPNLASVEPQGVGLVKFTADPDWTQLPTFFNEQEFYISLIKGKRNKFPTEYQLKIKVPGLVLIATPLNEPPNLEGYDEEETEGMTFVAPSEFVKKGWEPVGVAMQKGLPQILMRKNFEIKGDINFMVQKNLGPFLFLPTKPEYAQTISSLDVVALDNLVNSTTEVTVTDASSTFPDGLSPGENVPVEMKPNTSEQTEAQPGSPSAGQPGGLVGTILGIAKALSGNGPVATPQEASPVNNKPQTGDNKAMFIKNVSLEKIKCPVEREEVDRELHTDYRGGVVFFSNAESLEMFKKETDQNSAPANYQIFLTGQATQKRCPLSNNDFDEEYSMNVGYGKEVYFHSQSDLSRLEKTEASYKLLKMFGNTPFERAFEVAIPEPPSAESPSPETISSATVAGNEEPQSVSNPQNKTTSTKSVPEKRKLSKGALRRLERSENRQD